MFEKVAGPKRLICNADCQEEVSRCRTRGENHTGEKAHKQVIYPGFEVSELGSHKEKFL